MPKGTMQLAKALLEGPWPVVSDTVTGAGEEASLAAKCILHSLQVLIPLYGHLCQHNLLLRSLHSVCQRWHNDVVGCGAHTLPWFSHPDIASLPCMKQALLPNYSSCRGQNMGRRRASTRCSADMHTLGHDLASSIGQLAGKHPCIANQDNTGRDRLAQAAVYMYKVSPLSAV